LARAERLDPWMREGENKQYQLLFHIAVNGPANKYRLWKTTGLPKSTLLLYLERLKEEGLVEEVEGGKRGAKIVKCTQKGLAFIAEKPYLFLPRGSFLKYTESGVEPNEEVLEIAEKIVENYPNEAPLWFKWLAARKELLRSSAAALVSGMFAGGEYKALFNIDKVFTLAKALYPLADVALLSEAEDPALLDIIFINRMLNFLSEELFRLPLKGEKEKRIVELITQLRTLQCERQLLYYKHFLKHLKGESIDLDRVRREDAILLLLQTKTVRELSELTGLVSKTGYVWGLIVKALLDSGLAEEYRKELEINPSPETLGKALIAAFKKLEHTKEKQS